MAIYFPHDGFNTVNKESLEYCFSHGAVKINKFLSRSELNTISNGTIPKLPSLISYKLPSIARFFEIFKIDDQSKINVDNNREIEAVEDYQDIDPHVDSGNLNGISLVLPVKGKSAWFLANKEDFAFGDKVDYCARYGLRDAMLIRQNINSINGIKTELTQAIHMGASHFLRELIIIDYLNPDLEINCPIDLECLPAATATATATAT